MALKKGKNKSRVPSKKKLIVHITGGWLFLSLLIGCFLIFSSARPASTACGKAAPTTAAGYEQLLRGPVNGKWYHADFGQTVKLPNGKIMWVFGDTFIGSASATKGSVFVNNTALLTEKGCIAALTGPIVNGKETSWLKPAGVNDMPGVDDYYWPSTPFMDGSTLRMFLLHMYNNAEGFQVVGVDVATFSTSGSQPKLVSISKTPGSTAGGTTPLWGAGFVSSGGYNYFFGSLDKRELWVFGKYYYLARVPVGQTLTQANWRYWNGTTWVKSASSATPIINGSAGLATNISVYKKSNGEFVIITKKFDPFGTDLIALKTKTITGPWTEVTPALIAPLPSPSPSVSSRDHTYLGLGHPWIPLASRKLLVNWSLNFEGFEHFGDSRYGIYFSEVSQP